MLSTTLRLLTDGKCWNAAGGRCTSFLPGTHATMMAVCLGLGWLAPGSAAAQPFTELDAGLPALYSGAVVWGDYDGDGDLDLLATGTDATYSRHTRLYRNDSGAFTAVPSPFPALEFSAGAWGDFDGDGDLDLAVAGYLGPGLFYFCAVYRNSGGTFTEAARMPFGSSTSEIAWGDADGDGDLDLLLAEYGGIFRNDRTGFTWQWLGLPGVAFGAGSLADYDNDGDLDILLAGNPGNNIFTSTLYRNDGAGVFTNSGVALAAATSRALAWGDYDNDGDLDLLRADLGSTVLYRNNGDGTFNDSGIALPAVDRGGVAWGDFDNDGWLDFAVSGYFGATVTTRLYRNLGGTNFADSGASLAPVYDAVLAWGDYDNDGDLDLALTGYNNGPVTKIYRNDLARKNPPPNQPTGLAAEVRGNSVTLSWLATTDSNQVGGLSYNLRVAEASSIGNVMAPMAHLGTGRRLLPALGNAGQRLSWTVTNLPPAPYYYWAVQAIDHSYAGSGFYFTASNYFTITQPPTISNIPDQSIPAGFPTPLIPFSVGDDFPGASHLVLRATSSDTNLVPVERVEFFGADASRAVRVTPIPGLVGQADITVTVSDEGGNEARDTFLVTTTNTAPVISDISDRTVALGSGDITLSFVVGDLQTPAEALTLTAVSSNLALVPAANIVFGGAGSNRTVTITPAGSQPGVATIAIEVADAHDGRASDAFVLTVGAFEDLGAGLPGLAWGSVHWVDYDNDGDLDVFYSGLSNNPPTIPITHLYRYDGGSFAEVASGLPDLGGSSFAAWGDYDNDGRLDVLFAGYDSTKSVTKLFRNTGNPAAPFVDSGVVFPQLGNPGAAWGDYDGDGHLDLWVSGTTNQVGVSAIYRNNGDGTFTDIRAGLRTAAAEVAVWGDFDNDGDPDLLLRGFASISTGFATLYRNNGNGTFTDLNPGFASGPWGRCAWGDLDNDGDPDVLMSGSASAIYWNNGNGTFTPIALPIVSAAELVAGDFDNDGHPDVLEGGTASALIIYHNDGAGGFAEMVTGFPPTAAFSLAPGDYDRDGHLDVLCLGYAGGQSVLSIFRNTLSASNSPPAVPVNLAAGILSDASVVLTWERSSDAETTDAAGLSYNLRVGTTPGGVEVVSPAADPASGFLRLPGTGNVGSANRRRMVDLPAGTYYWSVQAIDPGLAGSAFAAEGSFTITNTRPRLMLPAAVGTSYALMPPPVPFTIGDAETPASDLVVAARSSNTNVLPDSNLLLAGIGSNRTVQVVPMLNHTGAVAVTLAVLDGGGITTTGSFLVNITNALPFISNIPSLTVYSGAPLAPIPFVVGDLETPASELVVSVSASPPASFPGVNFILGGTGSNRTLTLMPPPTNLKSSTITVTVRDDMGATASRSFSLNLLNPPPFISDIPNQIFAPGATIPPILFTVGDDNTPSSNIVVTVGASHPALVPGTHLVLAGAESNRVLTITPPPDWIGPVAISVTARDLFQAASQRTFLLTIGDTTIPVSALPALTSSSATWGDCNNDGLLDIFLTGRTTNGTPVSRLYRNNGDGTVTDLAGPFAPVEGGAGLWGDYDNDGFLDVLLYGTALQRLALTALYHNNHDGTFARVDSGLPAVSGGTLAWVDFDHDGRLDVFLAGFVGDNQSATRLYRNNGDGTFSVSPAAFPSLVTARPAWGDYDNDGDLDLLLTGRTPKQEPLTRLYRNDDSLFTEVLTALPQVAGMAAWGDYDNDGRLDFALSYATDVQPPATRVYRNLGGGAFTNTVPALPPVDRGTVAWGDYDNDGLPDLLLAGYSLGSPSAAIYRNHGNDSFSPGAASLPGINSGSASLGDFDRDGDLDVLLTGGLTALHTNQSAPANTPPTPPADLGATPLGNGTVLLSWTPGSDAETTNAAGLNYNLRVGTAPGAQDALAPAADLATGWRRLPAPGNAGPATTWRLRLPPGDYYWSVQAIDPALAGSQFAPEGTFTITNTPPIALDQSLTTAEDTPLGLALGVFDPDAQLWEIGVVDGPQHGTLIGTGANRIYRPATNYFGSDAFTFTVSDGLASSAPATVFITVTPVTDTEFTRLSIAPPAEGRFQLRLRGEPYQSYRIEVSEDLETWTELLVQQASRDGEVAFDDPVAGRSHRFYRPRVVP